MTAVVDPSAVIPALGTRATPPLLELRAVEKRFGAATALSGVSLALAPGSFVSMLGASGCGKSTLLRIVAGLASPSAGAVTWSGTAAGARRRIGCVFQDPTLLPWCSVLDNVLLPFRLQAGPTAADRARARELLAAVGLGGREGAYPAELSGGMKMRVSLARALVTEPELLLLDEPFAALDEITRLRLASDLGVLWRARRFTALFVTHSVFESVYLSDRVVVMAARPGRIFAEQAIEIGNRQDEGVRTSAAYAAVCAQVSGLLREAMGA